MAILIDSYSEANKDASFSMDSLDKIGGAQTITAIAATLDSCQFYLSKSGLPTGNATAKLYNITGTFGTTSKPTGAALATSDVFNVATLTSSFALTTLNFTGANRITLTNGTNYAITLEYSGGDGSNNVQVGQQVTSPTHAGNQSTLVGATWTADNTIDLCFYVYGITGGIIPRRRLMGIG